MVFDHHHPSVQTLNEQGQILPKKPKRRWWQDKLALREEWTMREWIFPVAALSVR